MKYLIVTFAMVGGALVSAARLEAGVDKPSVDSRIKKYCDPVCELRVQDSAFSLLVEAYRQFQGYQIQSDYQARLRAASGLSDEHGSLVINTSLEGVRTLRAWIVALATKERELRIEKLQTDVHNFQTAYGCVRRVDEEEIEATVPSTVDTEAAAEKLKTYNIIALGSLASGRFKTVKSVPATKIFYDAPPVDIAPHRLIEKCE